MNKQRRGKKAIKVKRPEWSAAFKAKKEASAMGSVEDLASALGIGINQAYGLVGDRKVPAVRFGKRWLIPRTVIEQLKRGELIPPAPTAA
jgi:excisionase family DNA binding protein